MENLVSLKNVDKSFIAIHAVNHVNLEIQTSEIISLVGENGAGKSTLAKIIAGVHPMDSGSFIWDSSDIAVRTHDVYHARKMGISMIFQETNLVPHLTIAENIFLGREPQKSNYVIDYKEMYRQAELELARLGVDLDTHTPVRLLSQAYKQLVEIVKALSLNARLIIMDEPTSSLTLEDTNNLLRIIKQLKQQGISVLYISHKLDEVLEISDRVIVMRDGNIVENKLASEMTKEIMINAMIGRDIKSYFHRDSIQEGSEILRVENYQNKYLVEPVSFCLHKGEILGFAGLIGAGRTELMQSLFGITPYISGEIYIDNEKVVIHTPMDAIRYGIGYVPEDRREQGLILQMTVKDNILLPVLKRFSQYGFRNSQKEENIAEDYTRRLQIKTSSVNNRITHLSGGNQQKVVLAKWLLISPKILIMDEPTRGIDVGAKAEIHRLIMDMAKQGMGIILVSSEMEEIIGMCSRVLVMKQRRLAGEILKEHISEETIMKMAAHSSNN